MVGLIASLIALGVGATLKEPTNLECYWARNAGIEKRSPLVFKKHDRDGSGKHVFVFQFRPKQPEHIAEFTLASRPGSKPVLTQFVSKSISEPERLEFDGVTVHGVLDHSFSRGLNSCQEISFEKLVEIGSRFSS